MVEHAAKRRDPLREKGQDGSQQSAVSSWQLAVSRRLTVPASAKASAGRNSSLML